MAQDVEAKAIIGLTVSGYTAFKISSYRPIDNKIYMFSDQNNILNALNLVWGVQTFFYDKFSSTDETIYDVVDILVKAGKLKQGGVEVLVTTLNDFQVLALLDALKKVDYTSITMLGSDTIKPADAMTERLGELCDSLPPGAVAHRLGDNTIGGRLVACGEIGRAHV